MALDIVYLNSEAFKIKLAKFFKILCAVDFNNAVNLNILGLT